MPKHRKARPYRCQRLALNGSHQRAGQEASPIARSPTLASPIAFPRWLSSQYCVKRQARLSRVGRLLPVFPWLTS
jgi:hypothetical protein